MPASTDDLQSVIDLLTACGLPHADLSPGHMRAFYVIPADGQLAACAGLEVFGRHALLRSMAVQSPLRLKGVGRELCEAVEQRAREEGVQSLYLLTTTAESFFSKRGFERCLRDEVPEAVRNCAEFQSLCPQSAAVMLKRL